MDFSQKIALEEITGGRSGAQIFKMYLGNQIYCLKFPQHYDVVPNLKKLQEICRIYQELAINSLEILGYGYYGTDKKQFCLFRYIPGQDFKTFSNQHCSLSEIYQAGIEIGQEAKKLKSYPVNRITYIKHENLTELTQHIEKLYRSLNDLLQETGLIEAIAPLWEIAQRGPDLFTHTPPGLIHGDIKRSNIVIDPSGNKYFIDIGAMKYSYDVLNFRYQMTWLLLPENDRKREFVKGFLDGLYNFSRPSYFHEQVIYVALLNFLEHTHKFLHDEREIREYFTIMHPILDRLINSSGTIL